MLPFPFAMRAPEVIPGAISYTTVGTFQFTVPEFNTLTVIVRGAGGGGAGIGGQGAGQSSSFGSITATGGGNAYNAPGTGINGDQNYTGGLGGESGALFGGVGGEGAYGGGAVTTPFTSGNDGNPPGGGGAGTVFFGAGLPGGPGGGAAVKTYNENGLAPGSQITVVVGAGGTISGGGGDGARGQVDISWN